MADVAAAVLAAAREEDLKYASILVEKPIPLEIDLGNMLAIDTNQLDNQRLADREQREIFLHELARENTQLLINTIWGLPTERVEDVVVAKFPPPTFRLPREKPVPKPKPLTKWEKYAKEKGIEKKKKKERVVWDDVVQQWVPQFGYKKNKVEDQKNWCIPIKEGLEPNLHPFETMAEEKKERIAKNELQRLRNIAKAKKIKLPTVGVIPSTDKVGGSSRDQSDDLKTAAEVAKTATASLGKFQPKLAKKLEQQAAKVKRAKKRHFEPNTGDAAAEKQRNLGILESLHSKKARLDLGQAVGQQIFQEDSQRSAEKKEGGGGGRKGGKKKGGKHRKGGKFAGKKGAGGGGGSGKAKVKRKTGGGGGGGKGKAGGSSSKKMK